MSNTNTMTVSELERQAAFYHQTLREAAHSGLTLRDPETREAWGYYRQLLAEQARRRATLQRNPHLYN